MDKFNLFSLLGVRLLENETHLTMNVYNVLFEVLVERMAHQIVTGPHPEFSGQELFIQNPGQSSGHPVILSSGNPVILSSGHPNIL